MRKISRTVLAAAMLAASAAPASAGHIWLTNSYLSDGSATDSGDWIFNGTDGVSARVSAWSIHGDEIHQGGLGVYSYGLGVSHGSGDQHTTDNSGYRDFLLFQFNQSVVLDNALFASGWHGTEDTDATIGYGDLLLPYTDALPLHDQPASILAGANLYASNTSGTDSTWDWGDVNFNFRDINPDNHAGNFWLVGASFDTQRYYDGFKLKLLTFSDAPPPAVPEPATWLMMILGFGLVGGVMRREKRKDVAAIA